MNPVISTQDIKYALPYLEMLKLNLPAMGVLGIDTRACEKTLNIALQVMRGQLYALEQLGGEPVNEPSK